MPKIELIDVSKLFYGDGIQTAALKNITLRFDKGEFVSIVGSSGSGKSTLLSLIGTLDQPSEGKVLINEKDVREFKSDQLADVRYENIGFIFQHFHLLPGFTVLENTLSPLLHRRVSNKVDRAKQILCNVGLEDKMNAFPSQLSGGQQQRVAIARALVTEPDWLLADEPTGNLDTVNGTNIFNLLRKINEERGCGVIYVTHDPKWANQANRKIEMKDGTVLSDQRMIRL